MANNPHSDVNPTIDDSAVDTELLPSLAGRWVTSFIELYPGDKPEPIVLPIVGEVQNSKWIVDQIAPLIPAYIGTLSCFVFKEDRTFYIDKRQNHSENGYFEEKLTGHYTIFWREDIRAGDIVIEWDETDSTTLKFFMNGLDELQFIVAHGTNRTVNPVVSGTMHRAKIVR